MATPYDKAVKGKLSFKGVKKMKKKRKAHESVDDSVSSLAPEVDRAPASNEITIHPGTGRITTSGITVQGYDTNFVEELSPGDAVIVFHPTTLQDETKIVRMVLSATSIGISSAFSTDLVSTTTFRYIKAPKDEPDEDAERAARDAILAKRDGAEQAAFGTYASAGGEKLVYRVKKTGAFGGYKIMTENTKGMSREQLLEQRSKKKSDRLCY